MKISRYDGVKISKYKLMKVKKIELNDDGIQELLKSDAMQAICNERAQRALKVLGKGYGADVRVGKTRCNADVHATTGKTHRKAIDDGTIYKAVFGC